jgi:hypothetical protein
MWPDEELEHVIAHLAGSLDQVDHRNPLPRPSTTSVRRLVSGSGASSPLLFCVDSYGRVVDRM